MGIRNLRKRFYAGLYRRDHRQHIERRPGHCKAGLYAVARRDAPKRPVHVLHRPVERHLQPTRPAHIITGWKAKYMEVWEFTVGECDPAEDYRRERAVVLNESFDNLIALASKKNESTEL